jgi:hypothetical protein
VTPSQRADRKVVVAELLSLDGVAEEPRNAAHIALSPGNSSDFFRRKLFDAGMRAG